MVKKVVSKPVTRSDGKASRTAILDATLIIILRDGIRSVKYKSVAEVAGVTQSSIAYYFKDIPQLITEAFLHYLEGYEVGMEVARGVGKKILAKYKGQDLQAREVREAIVNDHVNSLMYIIASGDEDSATYMLLDRIFRNEMLQNPDLFGALRAQDQKDLEAMEHFFQALGCKFPEEDAVQLFSLLWFLSERLLQNRHSDSEITYARRMLRNSLRQCLNLS
ncbi:TetR family transcriptional regulator [Maricurvus nonylphenolicus]|uniref:TetR/AcrR family transcriptional regulator n=1 Tax=Maricurvus nonylphenolicus TaxID=1008307 RepID=UPI0036F40F02